jgi:hypothetical protein
MPNAALVCFLILIPCSLRAQDKKSDWKALYGLHSGEKIELIETGMKKHVGLKRHRHSQRKRRTRDPAREEPPAPQRGDPRTRRRGSWRGNRRSGIEMQFD